MQFMKWSCGETIIIWNLFKQKHFCSEIQDIGTWMSRTFKLDILDISNLWLEYCIVKKQLKLVLSFQMAKYW